MYLGTDGIAIGSNAGSPQFKVLASGALTATSANITGAVTATSGEIAGWDIDADSISSGGITMDSANNRIIIAD